MPTKELTPIQAACYKTMLRHGGWPGGWYWDNASNTDRICAALVRKGYATYTEPVPDKDGRTPQYGSYRPIPIPQKENTP